MEKVWQKNWGKRGHKGYIQRFCLKFSSSDSLTGVHNFQAMSQLVYLKIKHVAAAIKHCWTVCTCHYYSKIKLFLHRESATCIKLGRVGCTITYISWLSSNTNKNSWSRIANLLQLSYIVHAGSTDRAFANGKTNKEWTWTQISSYCKQRQILRLVDPWFFFLARNRRA